MEMKWADGGFVTDEVKTFARDGVNLAEVAGYIASFKLEDDPFPDKFEAGAFLDSIAEHQRRGDRPIRLNFQHQRNPIGGFPIEKVREDARGLFGVAEINLDRQLGREVYALAKQGVIRDFSIGFIPQEWTIEEDTRFITKARIMEGSLVDEPMNPDAQVTVTKGADAGSFFRAVDVSSWTDRDLEAVLSSTKQFSRSAVKALVERLRPVDGTDPIVDESTEKSLPSPLLEQLNEFRASLKTG